MKSQLNADDWKAASYRRNGLGAAIVFSVAPCRFGYFLVAATPHGICAASLGDDAAEMENEFRREFAKAEIERNDSAMLPYVDALLQHIEGQRHDLALPLDIEGTTFQRRVWQALREIPYGQTRTYTQIAQEIGSPQSVRAVARACATNSLALLIPCHRVLRKDTAPSGYRWVLERKQKLLQHEAAMSTQI